MVFFQVIIGDFVWAELLVLSNKLEKLFFKENIRNLSIELKTFFGGNLFGWVRQMATL